MITDISSNSEISDFRLANSAESHELAVIHITADSSLTADVLSCDAFARVLHSEYGLSVYPRRCAPNAFLILVPSEIVKECVDALHRSTPNVDGYLNATTLNAVRSRPLAPLVAEEIPLFMPRRYTTPTLVIPSHVEGQYEFIPSTEFGHIGMLPRFLVGNLAIFQETASGLCTLLRHYDVSLVTQPEVTNRPNSVGCVGVKVRVRLSDVAKLVALHLRVLTMPEPRGGFWFHNVPAGEAGTPGLLTVEVCRDNHELRTGRRNLSQSQ